MTEMKTVVVTQRFLGVRDGRVHPEWIELGEIVSGDLAVAAEHGGWTGDAPTRGATAEPGAPEGDDLVVKHAGGGRWWLVRGEDRVKGPFASKAEAEAAR
ncbi:hypothetical protein [Azorhizobium doebereinerae]|uniref:hypothetical protein n=1 Tax=Azorhizobium doebereinerae TaxID=281091 RepID=UPI000427FD4F|nr:hypothetical protein [Azorhizobium doebereinerae]